MISFFQLETWAAEGESEILELKRTTGEQRSAAQTLCGMLNNRGGRVLFGVERNGRIIGQMVADSTIEDLVQELREIDPPVFPSIDRVPIPGARQVLVVSVNRDQTGPTRSAAGPTGARGTPP